jgi:FkbM family methyltransferase
MPGITAMIAPRQPTMWKIQMKYAGYTLHYQIRRWMNYALFRTVHRLRHGRELLSHGPLISNLSWSKASIDFVYRQTRDKILSEVAGLTGGGVVMDVGGDTGGWAMEIHERYKPRLYIYEPNPRSVEVLRERFKGLNAEIFPFGLGSSNQTCQLSDDGMGSSVYEASLNYDMASKFDIRIRDVREVFDESNLAEVDLIKINIEGGEYDLLPRLIETGLVSRCRIIRVQFHDWYPNAFALRRNIVNRLAETHDVEWSYPMVWESWIRREPRR